MYVLLQLDNFHALPGAICINTNKAEPTILEIGYNSRIYFVPMPVTLHYLF
jgi:hypothetical protein